MAVVILYRHDKSILHIISEIWKKISNQKQFQTQIFNSVNSLKLNITFINFMYYIQTVS